MKRSVELPTCMVCYDAPDGPIYQCVEGHLICKSCDEQLPRRSCPTCYDVRFFGSDSKRIRNRAVEDVIAISTTACEHCEQPMTRSELARHTPCPLYVNRLVKKEFGNRIETYHGLQGSEELASVAFDNGRTEVYEGGKLVRHEYGSPHDDDGITDFYEDGKRVRSEFRSPHIWNDGLTEFYEDGKIMRREYRSPHENDGLTEFYGDGKLMRREYRSPHENDGLTEFL